MYVEYSSNNSGGSWWLNDEDWHALEAAGWEVRWEKDNADGFGRGGDRFLGALAMYAIKRDTDLRSAIHEWETITGQRSNDLGCGCCGAPHSFTLYNDEDEFVDSYYPSAPSYGDPYDF